MHFTACFPGFKRGPTHNSLHCSICCLTTSALWRQLVYLTRNSWCRFARGRIILLWPVPILALLSLITQLYDKFGQPPRSAKPSHEPAPRVSFWKRQVAPPFLRWAEIVFIGFRNKQASTPLLFLVFDKKNCEMRPRLM